MRSATRVAPLQALRPEPPAHHQGLGVRGVLGVLAILTGIAALVGGTALALAEITGLGILLAMAGGVKIGRASCRESGEGAEEGVSGLKGTEPVPSTGDRRTEARTPMGGGS